MKRGFSVRWKLIAVRDFCIARCASVQPGAWRWRGLKGLDSSVKQGHTFMYESWTCGFVDRSID